MTASLKYQDVTKFLTYLLAQPIFLKSQNFTIQLSFAVRLD